MARTLDEIRRAGLEALCERLGRDGMIRFMQQFETGHGDYAMERHEWVDNTSLDQIRRAAGHRMPAGKKRTKRSQRKKS